MPKLLIILNTAKHFLTHRLPLSRAAMRAGYNVQVAAPNALEARKIEAEGFKFHHIPLSRSGYAPHAEARALAAIHRLYRRERPDIVHHYTMKPIAYGGIAARRCGIAAVHSFTGLGYVFTDERPRAIALRTFIAPLLRVALNGPRHMVMFQNADDRNLFVERGLVPTQRTCVVDGSGVDTRYFRPLAEPEGPPVVVLPARMLHTKGIMDFIDASKILRRRGLSVRMALAGDVDPGNPASFERAELETHARAAGVEWWGWQADMRQVYARAHFVCLPSYREGVPKVLLEAAACGRAVIATDVPGCRDVVVDRATGLLVPPRDGQALADAIATLAEDASMRELMGREGRDRVVKKYSDEIVVDQVLSVYNRLAG